MLEEKTNSPLFTKIYYKDIEENGYNLLIRPYNFPLPKDKEKNYLPLSEIATLQHGYAGKSQENGEFRFIQITDLNNQGEIIDNNKKYTDLPNNIINKEKFLLKKGEIIIAIVGATCGKTGIFRSEEKATFSSNLARININKEIVLPEYLFYLFQSQNFHKKIESIKKGTAQPYLDFTSLGEITFPIPPLEEQQKAIEELNSIEKMIKNSEENTKTLKSSLSLSLMRKKPKLKNWEILPPLNMDTLFLPLIEGNLGSLGLQI